MKRKRFLQGISLNVVLLGVVSLLTDVSSEMIHPLLPMFIVGLGGGEIVWQHLSPLSSFAYGGGDEWTGRAPVSCYRSKAEISVHR